MAENNTQSNKAPASKELRRLKRKDLLILMLEQAKQIEKLKGTIRDDRLHYQRELLNKDCAFKAKIEALEKEKNAQIELLNQKLESAQNSKKLFDSIKNIKTSNKSFFERLSNSLPFRITINRR